MIDYKTTSHIHLKNLFLKQIWIVSNNFLWFYSSQKIIKQEEKTSTNVVVNKQTKEGHECTKDIDCCFKKEEDLCDSSKNYLQIIPNTFWFCSKNHEP